MTIWVILYPHTKALTENSVVFPAQRGQAKAASRPDENDRLTAPEPGGGNAAPG